MKTKLKKKNNTTTESPKKMPELQMMFERIRKKKEIREKERKVALNIDVVTNETKERILQEKTTEKEKENDRRSLKELSFLANKEKRRISPKKQSFYVKENQLSSKGSLTTNPEENDSLVKTSRQKFKLIRANFSPKVQDSPRKERHACMLIDSPGKRKFKEVESKETANSVNELIGFYGSGNQTKRLKTSWS